MRKRRRSLQLKQEDARRRDQLRRKHCKHERRKGDGGGWWWFEIPSSDIEKSKAVSFHYLRFLVGYVLHESIMDEEQGDVL